MKHRIFVQSIFPAPYRAAVFAELNAHYDLFVAFERGNDLNRDERWFVNGGKQDTILLSDPSGKRRYDRELRSLKSYDAVIAYEPWTRSSMRLMIHSIRHHIPYLVNCDGAFLNRSLLKSRIKRFFISRAALCLAGSESGENYFSIHGAKPERVVRHNFTSLREADILTNAISQREKSMLRISLALPPDIPIVLSVGQFTHRKGFDILLQAWKKISSGGLLIILGGGEDESLYRRIIAESQLHNVTIEGFKSKDTIFDYYKASDVFVLPTREDVWGLVINEAMACGLPIITTDKCIAGLELIRDGENGLIVPSGDTIRLAAALDTILGDPEMRRRMGQANLANIRPFTIESVAGSHRDALNMLMENEE